MSLLPSALTSLSDGQLLSEVKRLAAHERQATAQLIGSLAELDARKLYVGLGYSSLFAYCVEALGLTEDATWARIEAARAVQRFPFILERLASGAVTLTAVKLLARHLTEANHLALLDAARGKRKREVEEMVVALKPRPDVPSSVRKLPTVKVQPSGSMVALDHARASALRVDDERLLLEQPIISPLPADPVVVSNVTDAPPLRAAPAPVPSCASSRAAEHRRSVVAPLAPERYKVQMTVDAATYAKLRRVQDLLRHSVPNGDVAVVFDRALTLLLERLERTKCAATKKPRAATAKQETAGRTTAGAAADIERQARDESKAGAQKATMTTRARPLHEAPVPGRVEAESGSRRSRHIPAHVKREVWARDKGRCAYVGTQGRCTQTSFLEYHHVVPFAAGGETTVANLRLACKAHNKREAERFFGDDVIAQHRSWPRKQGCT